MLCFLLTLVLENANGRSSSSHLIVMNHVIIDGDLGVHPSLPRPEQFIAEANSLENKDDRNLLTGRTFICPDNCRRYFYFCRQSGRYRPLSAVGSVLQLRSHLSHCLQLWYRNEGTSWIDSNRNDTKRGGFEVRTEPDPPFNNCLLADGSFRCQPTSGPSGRASKRPTCI